MIIARFSIQDKLGKIWFFEEIFLLADTSIDIILKMSFLAFSNVNILFNTESFTWKTYSAAKTLPLAKWAKLINKQEFAITTLNKNSETFVVHLAALKALKPALYLSRAPLLAAL